MAVYIRLIQLKMYLPNVSSQTDLVRALGALKRFCKSQDNIALSIEPYKEADRGEFSLTVLGAQQQDVHNEADHLIEWIETKITGQTLESNIDWV